ncbi:MAG: HAD-IA family hydrolase, partial [Anaerolineales bacterium]|nr:HAD-IA family hydrolase [Anaerolineales bacterium]
LHRLDFDKLVAESHGMRTVETMHRVAPHLDVAAEAQRFMAGEAADTQDIYALPGAVKLLGMIPAGDWIVVTSANRPLAKVRMQSAGLPLPEMMVTAEDVQRGKPDPEPYLLGAEKINTSVEGGIVIEDSPAGIRAAKAAGLRVIAVVTTHKKEELTQADFIVESLAQLCVVTNQNENHRLTIQIED